MHIFETTTGIQNVVEVQFNCGGTSTCSCPGWPGSLSLSKDRVLFLDCVCKSRDISMNYAASWRFSLFAFWRCTVIIRATFKDKCTPQTGSMLSWQRKAHIFQRSGAPISFFQTYFICIYILAGVTPYDNDGSKLTGCWSSGTLNPFTAARCGSLPPPRGPGVTNTTRVLRVHL